MQEHVGSTNEMSGLPTIRPECRISCPPQLLETIPRMMETAASTGEQRNRKAPYVLWMVGSFGLYALSLLHSSIRGPRLWAMFCCTVLVSSLSALKLRRLIHGRGWCLPQTNTALMWIVPIEALLYLLFSH